MLFFLSLAIIVAAVDLANTLGSLLALEYFLHIRFLASGAKMLRGRLVERTEVHVQLVGLIVDGFR